MGGLHHIQWDCSLLLLFTEFTFDVKGSGKITLRLYRK